MNRPTPRRGLLAGLLAVVVFASSAVAMTARGTTSATGTAAQTSAAGAVSAAVDDDGHDGGRSHDGDGRHLLAHGGRGD
jgi:hypothetical protein